MRTITISTNEVGLGMVLNYPVWHENRPADRPGNVWNEPRRVIGVDDTYPGNRVLWFETPGAVVVGREARLELVVPEVDEHLVDQLVELEVAIAEGVAEGAGTLERTAGRLAKVRGRIIERAGRPPAVPPAATVGNDPWLGQ